MRDDETGDELRVDELADPDARARRIIGDDCETALRCRTVSSISRGGVPTAMNPPIITSRRRARERLRQRT